MLTSSHSTLLVSAAMHSPKRGRSTIILGNSNVVEDVSIIQVSRTFKSTVLDLNKCVDQVSLSAISPPRHLHRLILPRSPVQPWP